MAEGRIGLAGRATTLAAAAAGLLLGVALGFAAAGACDRRTPGALPFAAAAGERGAELGDDDAEIEEIRVTVETGTVNGAGTDKPVLVWFDNQPHKLSRNPSTAFLSGRTTSANLRGAGVPRTLGELRRASILLTLHLQRAEIAASWYCERAAVEVLLEGAGEHTVYLESRKVGWLSQDEPPRRSPAYALQ